MNELESTPVALPQAILYQIAMRKEEATIH
jgi:hypothetical protein